MSVIFFYLFFKLTSLGRREDIRFIGNWWDSYLTHCQLLINGAICVAWIIPIYIDIFAYNWVIFSFTEMLNESFPLAFRSLLLFRYFGCTYFEFSKNHILNFWKISIYFYTNHSLTRGTPSVWYDVESQNFIVYIYTFPISKIEWATCRLTLWSMLSWYGPIKIMH